MLAGLETLLIWKRHRRLRDKIRSMNISSMNRWHLLALATATYGFTAGTERMCLPVLFDEIAKGLELSKVEVGTIWGMDPLAGVFVCFIAGLLVDRFGLVRMMAAISILAGLLGGLRGLSTGFMSLAAIMFVFGLSVAMTPTIMSKAAATWFFGPHLGFANGVLIVGMMLGAIMGTMLSATLVSPLLGGWRNVLFLYGVPPILLGVLWFLAARVESNREIPMATDAKTLKEALYHVASIKQVWILGIIMMGQMGSFIGLIGYLPLYLRVIGWEPMNADGMMTVLIGTSAIAAIPIAILSDRLGSRKKVFIPAGLMMATSLGLVPFVDGLFLWTLMAINGILRGGMFPLLTSLIVETEGIEARYAGTATGIGTTLGMIGGFLSPPLGNGLADIHPALPFIFWAVLSSMVLLGFFFVRERGRASRDLAS
jgi:cyanate permease